MDEVWCNTCSFQGEGHEPRDQLGPEGVHRVDATAACSKVGQTRRHSCMPRPLAVCPEGNAPHPQARG